MRMGSMEQQTQFKVFPWLLLGVFFAESFTFAAQKNPDPVRELEQQDQARLKVVIQYADNILKYGRDRYRRKPSPLFADGINVLTREHLKWVYPGGAEVVISDLGCQQNLCRMMTALTNLTGRPRYKNAVKEAFRYHFQHYQDASGLMQWGGHRFIDLKTLQITGPSEKEMVHELKNNFPDYDLMYEVDPQATVNYIKAFWNAHVYDWKTLEISRHGEYGLKMGQLWENRFEQNQPFFETKGLTFLNTGNDLIYAAGKLYQFTGDRKALEWGKLLAEQYVKARHPQTKLGVYQFSQPKKEAETSDDNDTSSRFGDRARRQFGPEFGAIALEGNMLITSWLAGTVYSENALVELEMAREIGPDVQEFLEWTREGMVAYSKYAYIPETNKLRPLLTDGTDLTDYALKRNGYYGKKGEVLRQFKASSIFLLSYARGFLLTSEPELWKMARGIAKYNTLGDLGTVPGQEVAVNLNTENHDPYVLFALLDVYGQTRHPAYLDLARRIGDNIVKYCFVNGFFLPKPNLLYANVDAIEPYALLALQATIAGTPEQVPGFVNGSGFIHGDYQFPDGRTRTIFSDYLFSQTRTAESPAR